MPALVVSPVLLLQLQAAPAHQHTEIERQTDRQRERERGGESERKKERGENVHENVATFITFPFVSCVCVLNIAAVYRGYSVLGYIGRIVFDQLLGLYSDNSPVTTLRFYPKIVLFWQGKKCVTRLLPRWTCFSFCNGFLSLNAFMRPRIIN